jgi:hypothetical protein
MMWRKGSLRSSFSQWGAAAALSSGVTVHTATMEVTAEQLAGQPNGTTRNPSPNVTTRRARRNRRTPSQISTRSLPAYNKEPGDEELVIFRWVPCPCFWLFFSSVGP